MIIARVKIGDFDQYWEVFSTRGAEKRAAHGSRGARVFRNADDPSEVIVLFDWDRADYEGFVEDPEVPEIFQAAGLRGRPEPTFVEPAGELAS